MCSKIGRQFARHLASALVLRVGDREELERRTRSDRVGARAAKRARIVLLAADGVANTRIAELTDSTVTTVLNWRGRYEERGIAGLADVAKAGRTVVPPESWRASLCGFPVEGRGVLVVDRAHHAR